MGHAPALVMMTALLSVAAFRAIVIGSHGEPSGLDFGNWLMYGYQALGHPLERGTADTYPPVVPVLAVAGTKAFGVVWGMATFAGLASTAPGLGVYVACRLLGARWSAVLAGVLLAATSSSGEAAAWGGLPQLVGLGLTAAILGVTLKALERRRWQNGLAVGALLLALGATSHLVFFQAAAALCVLVVVWAPLHRHSFGRSTWLGKDGWVAVTFSAVAPLVVLVPLYIRLWPTIGGVTAGSGPASPLSGFLQAMYVIYRDSPWFWKPVLIISGLTPLLLCGRRYRARPLWAIVTCLDISIAAEGGLLGQERLVYVTPLAVGFALALWVSVFSEWHLGGRLVKVVPKLPRLKVSTALAVVLALGTLDASVSGLRFFPAQRDFYGALVPPGTVAGLDWLRDNTPRDALVAVAPENGIPFGWWVQGYGRRAALVGSEDQWLNFPSEQRPGQ